MSIKDYDTILKMVEENITLNKEIITTKISKAIGLPERRLAEFFQNIYDSDRTLKQYIVDRRNLHAAEDFAKGLTMDMVCEKYGMDAANFNRAIRCLLKKTPTELRKERYSCPKPAYVFEIVEKQVPSVIPSKSNINENIYIEEIKRLEDENESLRIKLSKEREVQLHMGQGTNDINHITNSYMEFLKIENARIIYGFTVPEVLKLYQKSLSEKQSFIELCSDAIESYEFEMRQEMMPDKLDLIYHDEDEMDIGEAYEYYFGDDDPYTSSYDPWRTPDCRKYELYESYTDMKDLEDIEREMLETEQDFDFDTDEAKCQDIDPDTFA